MENKCNGKCEECSVNQRTYCASQMAYYAQQQIAEIKAAIVAMGRKDDDGCIVVLRKEDSTDDPEKEDEDDEA